MKNGIKNIKTEKITKDNPLTIEEQNQLLDDTMMLSAVIVGHQKYLESIGKLNEGTMFVKKFLDELTAEQLHEEFNKADA